MIEYLFDSDLGTFGGDHIYNPEVDPSAEYVQYALSVRTPIDISTAYSCLGAQTDSSIQRLGS